MLAMKKAVLWDFGGVILASPFEAFRRYEAEHDLPIDFIRGVNTTNPHGNAWALMERNEISTEQFDDLFAVESERARARGAWRRCAGTLSGSGAARNGGDARPRQGCRLSCCMPDEQHRGGRWSR